MKLPSLPYSSGIKKTVQIRFGGYNHTKNAKNGELYDMQNLSFKDYPLMSSRPKRLLVETLTAPQGIYNHGKLVKVDGNNLYYDGVYRGDLKTLNCMRKFASLGKRLVIYPDKMVLNCTYDRLGVYATLSALTAAVTSPSENDAYGVGSAEPYEIYVWNGSEWKSNGLELANIESTWSGSGVMFQNGLLYEEEATANTIFCAGVSFSDYFKAGDAVTISGCTIHTKNNKTSIIREIDGDKLYFYENVFTLHDKYTVGSDGLAAGHYYFTSGGISYYFTGLAMNSGDTIVWNGTSLVATISGTMYSISVSTTVVSDAVKLTFTDSIVPYVEIGTITIARTAPDLDYICTNENRVWGVHEDTVYACKLGDPFNWNVFDSLTTDSFFVNSGSTGDFTGCFSYGGYPIFTKEESVFKMYGSIPTDFQLVQSVRAGIMNGCAASFAVADETGFYLSSSGPVAYTGGIPTNMGDIFGTDRYRNAVAGSDGRNYYISMQGVDDKWILFTYNKSNGIWMKEDATHALAFAYVENNLYMLCSDGKLWIVSTTAINAPTSTPESAVSWYAEFGDMEDGEPNAKAISRLQLRVELNTGATMTVAIKRDSENEWHTVKTLPAATKRSYAIPILPVRADHYRIKLSGTGDMVLHSMAKEQYTGSGYAT